MNDNIQVTHRNNSYKKLQIIQQETKFTFIISAITNFLLLLGLTTKQNNKHKTSRRSKRSQQS